MNEVRLISEQQIKRWLADDYRKLRAGIDASYPTGMWIGIAQGRIVSVTAYLVSAMERAGRGDENATRILWVQAGIRHRETLVVERAYDFDDRWFGYSIAPTTLEERNQAFREWEAFQKRPHYTTEQVIAMLKRAK